MSESTDPGAYTIAQLTEWAATADPADVQAALDAEQANKNRAGAVAALEAALGEVEGLATTTKTKDYMGRTLLNIATAAKDYMGRLCLTGDKDYNGRSLVA